MTQPEDHADATAPDSAARAPQRARLAYTGQHWARKGVIAIAAAYLTLLLSQRMPSDHYSLAIIEHLALVVLAVALAVAGGLRALGGWVMIRIGETAPQGYFDDEK